VSPTASVAPTSVPSTPEASATPVCMESHGAIENATYPGAVVVGDVRVMVFLPPCYARGGGRFPVLVALHGYPYDESHWADLGLLDAAEAGIVAGDLAPMIIVLPLQPEPLYRSTDGGPRSYEEELLQGLLPFVDSAYRTEARPESRTLAGISRGGVWALEIGLRHPEVFDSVVGLSAALSLNAARPEYDPLVFVGQAERLPSRVYLVAGEEDWALATTRQMDAMLQAKGVPSILEVRPGSHADATWVPVMANVLRFAAGGGSP
jgi:enterochelin esterase-like enzyme